MKFCYWFSKADFISAFPCDADLDSEESFDTPGKEINQQTSESKNMLVGESCLVGLNEQKLDWLNYGYCLNQSNMKIIINYTVKKAPEGS